MSRRGEASKNWTQDEVKRVTTLFEKRLPHSEIAQIMCRTECSISGIKMRLGISVRRPNREAAPIRTAAPRRLVGEPKPGDGADYREMSEEAGKRATERFIAALKAAGHAHGTGELNITSDSVSPMRMLRPAQLYSPISSPAAMCAEIQG